MLWLMSMMSELEVGAEGARGACLAGAADRARVGGEH